MSATNRSDVRAKDDYYITPQDTIMSFLKSFTDREGIDITRQTILDPSAGGDNINPMAYPTALNELGLKDANIGTIDIREDSPAKLKYNFLSFESKATYSMVITNPPFAFAEDFIEKSLDVVCEGGYVIMLLRLNFLGSQKRHQFWKDYKPKAIYVHSKRPSFTQKGTDATEYAHFVWKLGYRGDTLIHIIN